MRPCNSYFSNRSEKTFDQIDFERPNSLIAFQMPVPPPQQACFFVCYLDLLGAVSTRPIGLSSRFPESPYVELQGLFNSCFRARSRPLASDHREARRQENQNSRTACGIRFDYHLRGYLDRQDGS